MKSKGLIIVVLVLSLLLAGFAPQSDRSWSDPTATALSGTSSFTTAIINPSKLAGAYESSSGTPLPKGFPVGEMQFGGNAFQLKGANGGSQKICFAFPTYYYGWRGGVYQWNGLKWAKMSTSITEGAEGSPTQACATSYGNGIYALLIWFDQNKAPVVNLPAENCIEDLHYSGYWGSVEGGIHGIEFVFNGSFLPENGTPFTWALSGVSPSGYITPLSGSGTTYIDTLGPPAVMGLAISGIDTPDFDDSSFTFTLKTYFPECHSITYTIVQSPQ